MSHGAARPEAPLDIQIRNTTANIAVILIKLHNIQVDLSAMRKENKELREQIVRLLYDPETRLHAEAAELDVKFNTPNNTKRISSTRHAAGSHARGSED